MTDHAELIERLRGAIVIADTWKRSYDQAASRINALVAERDALREALTWFDNMRQPLVNALYVAASRSEDEGGDPKYWDALLDDLRNSLQRTRSALTKLKATGEA